MYKGDKKDVEINDKSMKRDKENENKIIDVTIATSTIQAIQSLTENVLQVFIQTSFDTIILSWKSIEELMNTPIHEVIQR